MNVEQVRQDQAREGQRRLSLPPGAKRPPRKPFVAKGHDSFLKDIQDKEGYITITKTGDGSEITGKLIARDKFTITIMVDGTRRVTIYKHAIESFEPAELN